MTKFNPEMLVLAREVRALSQVELAELSAVSQSKVSKIEAGLIQPSDDDLRQFVQVLADFPLEFFLRPGTRQAPGSSCIFHRKRQSLPAKDLRRIHAHLDWLRIQVEQLLTGMDFNAPRAIYRIDVDSFDGDAERIASVVRQGWGLPPGPIDNLMSAIENAGGIVVKTSFGTDKIDALSQWPKGMPPIFFANADIPGDRLRFSLAHELGHLVMHAIPTGDLEKEADRFAAELLMPSAQIAPELMGRVDVKRLAALKPRWKVSMQAMAKRASDLEIITDRQYRTLFMLMGKMGWRKSEPVPIQTEEPSVIPAIIDAYTQHKGYSIQDISQLALCNEVAFKAQHFTVTPKGEQPLRIAQ